GGQGSGEAVSHAYQAAGTYTVELTVTDDDAADATDTLMVEVESVAPPPNEPPVASAGPDRVATVAETLQFDGSGSSDSDGEIVAYDWDFGDGSQGSGEAVSHTYQAAGTYTVELTVTDDDGEDATDTLVVEVENVAPPPNEPPIAVAGPDRATTVGEALQFDGSNSSDPDGEVIAHDWTFGDGAQTSGVVVSHTYQDAGSYTALLTVTDNDGESATDELQITVAASEPPPPPPEELTMHVSSIQLTLDERSNNRCRAIATVLVADQDDDPVDNVAVSGRFVAEGYDRTMRRRTAETGQAVLRSAWRRPCPTFTLEVVNLQLGGYTYEPGENAESSETISP
ncbi:MAG: PKD domain-containing protein, partial [Pseudomonadota bacterium]